MNLDKEKIEHIISLLSEYKANVNYTINICNDNIKLYSLQKRNPYAGQKIERSEKVKEENINKLKDIDEIINSLQKE